MPTDSGFLERLGVGGPDARAALQAERAKQGNSFARQQRSLGQQASPLFRGGAQAVGGLLSGNSPDGSGRSLGGIAGNFNEGFKETDDRQMAAAVGQDVDTFRRQRSFKQALSQINIPNDGTFTSRIKIAQEAARLANEHGLPAQTAAALAEIDSVKKEQAEFAKLEAQKGDAQAKETAAGLHTGFDSEGKPQTGILDIQGGVAGLNTSVNGELVFKPFDENFSLHNPRRGGADETTTVRLARIIKTDERKAVRSLATSAATALAKTDRVMSSLVDLQANGGAGPIIGTSGGLITGVDNLVRNVNGVIQAFSARGVAIDARAGTNPDGSVRSFNGVEGLVASVSEAGNQFAALIKLPEGVRRASAAAQQHQAAVMEMAYMAARLAEPSNRGLSDNDIKNALARIAGDTSNPQVMMRRFIEMQVDAAGELDRQLSLYHGAIPGISDDEVDRFLVGNLLPQYRRDKAALFDKFGVTVDDSGRATFEDLIGDDVAPEEGITPPDFTGGAELSREDLDAEIARRTQELSEGNNDGG